MAGTSIKSRILRFWRSRILRKERIPESLWLRVIADIPVVSSLSSAEKHRLRELGSLFLHRKTIVGGGDFEIDEYMRTVIAAQACLLILNLSLDYFDGWSEVIVYPDAFVVPSDLPDENGVVHHQVHALGGQAWGRGPVLLSWQDIQPVHPSQHHGVNVVLHEFAHKLDMLDGAADGMPPLHREMKRANWTTDFTRAYTAMLRHIEGGHRGRIDPYAVESPAEFFAVVTEFFFERPHLLKQELPAVYNELELFYRQTPLERVKR